MDGTGKLFQPILEIIPSEHSVTVCSLVQKVGFSYNQQAIEINRTLKDKVIVLAESYSGMIALELAQIAPEKIQSIIFVASFLSPPSKISKLGHLVPKILLTPAKNPNVLMLKFLFGKYLTSTLATLFQKTMDLIDIDVMQFRLKQIAKIKPISFSCNIPALYLAATSDNLVSKEVIKNVNSIFTQLNVEKVDGTHFLLQTNPKASWRAMQQHVT